MAYSQEQLRLAENLDVAYDAWMQVERERVEYRDSLVWKTVGGTDYLYRLKDRHGNGESLGARSSETESFAKDFAATKTALKERGQSIFTRFDELGRLYRSLRLPRIDDAAARVLQEADRRQLLGDYLLVVGTNALAAYEMEAMCRFASGLDATEDCDLTWAHEGKTTFAGGSGSLMQMLKAVDSSYTVNMEQRFQARNKMAYEVEFLLPESLSENYPSREAIRPLPLPEQDWLLRGNYCSHVVMSRRGLPARLVVPDPRWFALHKAWLAEKPGRNRRKIAKDAAQARAVWAQLSAGGYNIGMPGYPLDDAFKSVIPDELSSHADALSAACSSTESHEVGP